ncbi:MAG: rod shape-determining protein MreD [Rhodospirillaceae bacterium]|nr:rod shape-determining protein MreD [Rhodospirillaceae bacterium]
MKSDLLQRFDYFARGSTPFVLTVLLVVLGAVPMRLPELASVTPLLPLMAVYHWTIYRPDLLPAWAVFFAGLLQDALVGTPFGVHALVFLGVHMAVLSQQVFFTGKSFAVIWIGFALVAAGAMAMMWVLISLFYSQSTGLMGVAFQYLVTLGVFPVLTWLMLLWQRRILV